MRRNDVRGTVVCGAQDLREGVSMFDGTIINADTSPDEKKSDDEPTILVCPV